MKQSEISELSTPELIERIENEESTLGKMQMAHVVSPMDNPMQLRHTRRDIARMKTELKKRNSNQPVTEENNGTES